MSEKNFAVTGSMVIDDITLDLTATEVGSSIYRSGSTIIAKRETPVGTVVMYTGAINVSKTNVPSGWLLCDGSEVAVSLYPELDAVISTRYGSRTNGSGGSGTSHFVLPNLVDGFPVGGLPGSNQGQTSGSAYSAISSHSHTATVNASTWGDGASEFSGHSHPSINAHSHSHGTYGDSGGTGTHNLAAGGQHTHQYKQGTVSANTGASDSNHNHNVSNEAANHYHNGLDPSANHSHNGDTANLNHSHDITINTGVANMTMNNNTHQHSTGLAPVKVFFIIKT
jgi:microcystin-dependent protein